MTALTSTPTELPKIKMILVGYTGLGKSSAIIPLGLASYHIRCLDFDGKFEEVVREQLAARLSKKSITKDQHDEALTHFDICLCRETTTITEIQGKNGRQQIIGVLGQPTAWRAAVRQIKEWDKAGWTDKHILVIDSFTHATKVIANFTQALSNKLNLKLEWRDYQAPQQLIQDFLTILADLPCHTIMTGHQEPLDIYKKTDEVIELKDGTTEPKEELVESVMTLVSLGTKGRVNIPSQFNHMLVVALNSRGERRIFTVPEDGVVTKTPFWARAEKSYPLEDGLPRYFALRETAGAA
jgi:hypothetical protein